MHFKMKRYQCGCCLETGAYTQNLFAYLQLTFITCCYWMICLSYSPHTGLLAFPPNISQKFPDGRSKNIVFGLTGGQLRIARRNMHSLGIRLQNATYRPSKQNTIFSYFFSIQCASCLYKYHVFVKSFIMSSSQNIVPENVTFTSLSILCHFEIRFEKCKMLNDFQ